ncbi:UDP-glucose 4-epimerase GalE [Phytoactinopolyspora mesophila]|uniref:UDP-glucose 4-epimerase n=1 Tax=Phytoactinopolyspora mesophila TaxID=2650750 RepID=A0A7K3M5C8_9ACTN|nr:UDP-glucose 4-epimerase GalE [Phytoactinopolyspora mesophila]NDL58514.1 UDP-glucose 4-epimerase GalE [Phytoactinopolyspora mesophila]
MSWLVTGGAGYIGAHVVASMVTAEMDVVIVDDLSTGDSSRVATGVPVVNVSLLDQAAVRQIFTAYNITGVIHLAAKKRVDESLRQPSVYFRENVEALRILLDECARAGVRNFLFSSSAAVYGNPGSTVVDEDVMCLPTTPYGQTKLAGEWLVHGVGAACGMRTTALRYFNVAGAASPGLADTYLANLVPIVLDAVMRGRPARIFGDDYPTADGTCVRDYIHVADVADAHIAAAQALENGDLSSGRALNIGTGRGVSVREVVEVAMSITGSDVAPVVEPRRAGDSPAVVAAVERAHRELQWKAVRTLDDMIASAWEACLRVPDRVLTS